MALDKFVSEGLAEIVSFKQKSAGVDNFPCVCVEIAWDTGSVIGHQGRGFDPASRRSGQVLCFEEENGQLGNLSKKLKVVNPGREGILSGTWELLDKCIVRRGLGA